MDSQTISELFGAGGALAAEIPGFSARAQQQDMAVAVAEAFDAGETLAVEAGTGTGKTFAYLVPALLSGKRVVISTGTKNLQDQLYHRDLPRVRQALRTPARTALLKGRANYLCLYRLERAGQTPGLRFDPRLSKIESWAKASDSGEVSELGALTDDATLMSRVTSTADNCLGSKCPDFGECYVVKARRAAQGADLVVVNHHLLFADFVLKEEGFGEILPGADAVIIDEAHQLPELAAQFFGIRVSTRQLLDLSQDVADETGQFGDLPDLDKAADQLRVKATQLEAVFATTLNRMTLDEFLRRPLAPRAVEEVQAALDELDALLKIYAQRSPELAACSERCADLHARSALIGSQDDDSRVRWTEPRGRGGSLHATPIDIADGFRRIVAAHPGPWVLTSATLAAAGDFRHFCEQLGLEQARTMALDSPFDFTTQARLYLPRDLPDPGDASYTDCVIDLALPMIEASGGGAFLLCTSHRALRLAAQKLRGLLKLPLFVQNEDSRASLLERFAAAGNGVLVGTSSFWEGVDVKGRSLRLVIIDKLPFTAPGDPVFDAKLDAIRRRGGNPFMDHQLPEAIVMLRQGVGRLIRDAEDRGLLMLCDPRLRTKSYGRRVLAALPAIPQVDSEEALRWLRTL